MFADTKKYESIDMGLNTEPAWIKAEAIAEKFRISGDNDMASWWIREKKETLALRDKIRDTVERDGACYLVWGCTGKTRQVMHSMQWADAMPEYDFVIDGYSCLVKKKGA